MTILRFDWHTTQGRSLLNSGFWRAAAIAVFGILAADRAAVSAESSSPGATPKNSIRDFGAKCDGVTDDYAAITAALSRSAGAAGAVVFFPGSPKPCTISQALKVPANVTLQAQPGSVTITSSAGSTSNPLLMSLSSGDAVSGLSFDGGGSANSNDAAVILGTQISGVVLDHISVRHSRGIGVMFSHGVTNTVVKNSSFSDLGNYWKVTHNVKDRIQGVVFCCGDGNSKNTASNNDFTDIGLDALQFSEQKDTVIAGNHFRLENDERIGVPAPDYPAALFLKHINGATIADNQILGAQGNCIDAPAMINAVVTRNELQGCGAVGIGLFDGKGYGPGDRPPANVQVYGNKISNVGLWSKAGPARSVPIFVDEHATGVTVHDNQIR